MAENELHDAARRLAEAPTKSTKHMSLEELTDGIAQMLDDLDRLARRDGCIAAAWALEKLLAFALCDQEAMRATTPTLAEGTK